MPFIKNVAIFAKKAAAVVIYPKLGGGVYYSTAIDKNGKAFGWGYNPYGQVGDNTIDTPSVPVSVQGAAKTFCEIASGDYTTIAIDKNGRVWAWGYNFSGQLGNNSSISQRTPVSILGTTKTFCKIDGGNNHTVALEKNGRVWAWGANSVGQLGDNSTTQKCTPISILGTTKTFCQISAGASHTVGIDKNGRAWGWGNNVGGRLGNNSTTNQCTPVSVFAFARTFCKIAAGGSHTVAIEKTGIVWAWGSNSFGQLGINSNVSRLVPTSILGTAKTFCEISAGTSYTVAIDKNGKVWAWGDNQQGQLGDNSTISKLTPVSICGAAKTFCRIVATEAHTIAVDKTGKVWAWGYNTFSGLGNAATANRSTPVAVCVI